MTKLFFDIGFSPGFSTLYLRPDGSMKNWFRGWSVSTAIARARCVMAVSFMSVGLG